MTKQVTASDAKAKILRLLDDAASGDEIEITKHGRPVAAVAAISWFELAWLARHERIVVNIPIRSWLEGLAAQVRTLGITPAIADASVALRSRFRRIRPAG